MIQPPLLSSFHRYEYILLINFSRQSMKFLRLAENFAPLHNEKPQTIAKFFISSNLLSTQNALEQCKYVMAV